jgi:hypothetical protein
MRRRLSAVLRGPAHKHCEHRVDQVLAGIAGEWARSLPDAREVTADSTGPPHFRRPMEAMQLHGIAARRREPQHAHRSGRASCGTTRFSRAKTHSTKSRLAHVRATIHSRPARDGLLSPPQPRGAGRRGPDERRLNHDHPPQRYRRHTAVCVHQHHPTENLPPAVAMVRCGTLQASRGTGRVGEGDEAIIARD